MPVESRLKQGKSSFILKGYIEGKDNPAQNNGFKCGIIEKGISKGLPYNSIKFKVKTSSENIIPVEIFGVEEKVAYFYSEKEKKTVKVDWNKRFSVNAEGYRLILPKFDLAEKINREFKDGDYVRITGEIQHSTYIDKSNLMKLQTKYIIKNIALSEVNTYSEEVNSFTEEIVIENVEKNLKDKILNIEALIIGYADKINRANFIVDMNKNSEFANKVASFRFGDSMKVSGKINYCSIYEKVNNEFGASVISKSNKSLEVLTIHADTIEPRKYRESDLFQPKEESVSANTYNPYNSKKIETNFYNDDLGLY